ncbi:glycosyltransferase [Micromonospora sp. CA-263727]|uniref:glycosyltransferase n=1 Tax=Micromonospora sp. CA-263727 TaxID=3239967 RepID=UPI003D91454D
MPGSAGPLAPARTDAVAVVICVYTAERLPGIREAVAVAGDQLGRDGDELVVVVDHNERLLRLLAAELPGVTVVANAGERGLSAARNTGVAASTAPVVVFLDDDAVPGPGWLSAWRRAFADPSVMMAGGAVSPDWSAGRAPRWFPEEFGWVVGCDYRGIAPSGAAVRNPIGANMAIRRSALDRVGPFTSRLGRLGTVPAGCEETELGIRVGRAFGPGAVVRTGTPAVRHRVPPSRATVGYFLSRCRHEGRSKALLAAAAGRAASLSTERRYVLRTLPAGVLRHAAALLRGDLAGPARGALLVAGLTTTAWGFLAPARRGAADPPTEVAEVELAGTATAPLAAPSAPASVLVRLRGIPVGRVSLDDPATSLESAVEASLTAALRPHLERAGAPVPPQAAAGAVLAAARACPPGTPPAPSGRLVTVVLCTLGTEPRLSPAVEAVLAQSHADLDVVVVDNAPATGATARLLSGLDDPRLRIVPEPRRGLSHARNTGLAAAHGAVVAFTDDDALPDAHWVAELLRGFDSAPQVGCVTGLVTPARLATRWERYFEEHGGFDKGYVDKAWSVGQLPEAVARTAVTGERGPLFPYAGGNYGSGNNMAFRAEVLRAAGGFDPALGAGSPARGGEDLDAFRAVLVAGHVIRYTPSALVRHYHRATGSALRRQLYGYGAGFTAVVTKHLLSSPRTAWRMARGMPRALRVVADPRSPKYAGRSRGFPVVLGVAEALGYLAGPWLLLRGRLRARRVT